MENVKRRIVTTMMMVLMTVILCNITKMTAKAEILTGYCGDNDDGENVTWSYDSVTKTLSFSGLGSIKNDLQSYPWARFKSVTDVIIFEDGVTNVPKGGFQSFTAKNVRIGKDIEIIENDSFYLSKLESIEIPGNVNKIDCRAFRECFELKHIIVDEGVKELEESAFERVGWGSSVIYLPSTITKIHNSLFGGETHNETIVYGKNDLEKEFFEYTEVTYIDASEGINISNCEASITGEYFDYTGSEIKPAVTISQTINEKTIALSEGYDYSLSYKNNINRGTATVIITGIGAYNSTFDLQYNITTSITECDVVLDSERVLYDGNEKIIGVSVKNGEIDLIENTDYEVDYSDNIDEGLAAITISGREEYRDSVQKTFEIYKNIITDVSLEYESVLYDGKEKKPNVTVKYDEEILEENRDYEVSYSNNVEEGLAWVTVSGIGSYKGGFEIAFSIYKGIISYDNINLEYESVLYDGTERKPNVTVKYDEEILEENRDYEVSYSNNVEEGIASVKITGKGNYKGEVVKEFTIYKNVITDKDCALEYSEVLFDASAKKPNVTVKYEGNDLVLGKDYKVDYANNTDVGEATVTITGMGSYKGTVTKSFSIYKYDLTKANVSLSYEDVLYDGAEKVPEISVTYDGKNLVKDKDYSVEINGNTLPGVATIKIIGINQYSGMVEKSFTITALSIENADVALKESIYSYDGSPKTPSVDVKLGEKMLVKDTDYTLTYENNIDDGTAHAVVTGTGIYKDVIKVSFVILPYNAGMDAVYPEGTLIDDDYVYGVTDDETNEVEFFCPANQKIKSVQIPATVTDENGTVYTVTSIGNKAFYKNTKITSVTVGNNVKSIEDYAFYGCKNVTSIKLGKNVEMVGNSAFRKCTKLTSITLPKALNALGKNAFYGCSKLKTITINANSVVDVKTNAIKGVSKKCVIKVPKKLVKKYKKEFDKKSGFGGNMKVKKK